MVMQVLCDFMIGDRARKSDGDYTIEGEIVAVFTKKSGKVRVVIEDERGLLLIHDPRRLEHAHKPDVIDERRAAGVYGEQ